MFSKDVMDMLIQGIFETLFMTVASTVIAYIIGLPLGIAVAVVENKIVKSTLDIIINIGRSIPFLILLVAIQPFTRFIVGSSIGTVATVVPLVVASAPFIARLVEQSLKEVDKGIIEAAQSMGASPMQIITKVMLPEAGPSIMVGAAIATTTILSYSAMAGIVGGGGLGDIAIRYGMYRWELDIMIVTVVIIVILVQVFQEVGMRIAKSVDKRI